MSARRSSRRRAWWTLVGAAFGVAALIVPASAQTGAVVDLGAQGWQQAASSGFGLAGPTTIAAPAGIYSAGSAAGFWWCTPYANSIIQSAVVHVTRAQAASAVDISAGPNSDGSGGLTTPDADVPTGSVGTNLSLDPLGSACVGARVRQTQAAGTTVTRTWTLSLADVVLDDQQGPSVADLQIRGAETNDWYTGPITVLWEADDNALLRGTTGLDVSDGATIDLGDAADNTELSATLDPGADGPHTVTVYRTGGGGWPTAEASVAIKVDRTPPTVPQMIAPPAGEFPVVLTTTPSIDGATGSGVAGYQFTADGGATILASNALTRPGTYTTQARAVDVAGNITAWSLPIEVLVPANGSGSSGGAGGSGARGGAPVLHLTRVTIDGRAPGANATIAVTRTWGQRIRVVGTLADALGTPAARARLTIADARGALAHGVSNAHGQFVLPVPVRRSGALTLSADRGGALTRITLRMRPLLSLTAAERRAITGRPLPLGPHRVISISGTASPAPLAAGRPVQLEYLLGHAWLPLGVPATIAHSGRWRLRYAVTRPGHAVIDVRVVLPSQPGLAFAAGISPVIKVAIS